MDTLSIAKDFSTTPGLRYRHQSKYSGQEFRDEKLIPAFDKAVERGEVLVVDLDGTAGYPPSFIEEAFGGLVSERGYELVVKHLDLIGEERRHYVDLAHRKMKRAAGIDEDKGGFANKLRSLFGGKD